MKEQITCPNCSAVLPDHPLIDAAFNKDYSDTSPIMCECGKNVSFWSITAQLREQNTRGQRFKNWIKEKLK